MAESDSSKKYAFMAAICCIFPVVYSVTDKIVEMVRHPGFTSISGFQTMVWVVWAGFVITLFMRKIQAVIGVTICYTLMNLYHFIFISGSWDNWRIFTFCTFAAGVSLIIILFLTLQGKSVVRKLWYIPVSFMVIRNLLSLIGSDSNVPFYMVIPVLIDFVEAAAFLFIGLWLRQRILSAAAITTAEQ